MSEKTLLEDLPDQPRICVMLRADGWSYEEIADFLGTVPRRVRQDLESVAMAYPGLLDYRRPENRNRLMRLVYLIGVTDGHAAKAGLEEHMDSLVERATWLRSRMRAKEIMSDRITKQRAAASRNGSGIDEE